MGIVQPHSPRPSGEPPEKKPVVKRRSLLKAAQQKPRPIEEKWTRSNLPVQQPKRPGSEPSLTTTATFTSRALTTTGVFRLSDDANVVESMQMDAVQPDASWLVNQGELPVDAISDAALLVTPQTVIPEEIEALAVSLFDDVAWIAPGKLRLHQQAVLEGPYHVTSQVAQQLGLRKHSTTAYILRCPQQRSGPLPPELHGISTYNDIFADAIPAGLEDLAMCAMIDIATRLAADICFMRGDTPHVYTPDPEEHINLYVYSPRVIEAVTVVELLHDILPGLDDASLPDMHQTDARQQRRAKEQDELYRKAIAAMDPAVVEQAKKIVENAAAAGDDVVASPYEFALRAPSDNYAAIYVQSHITDYTPPALRWEDWAGEKVMVYEVTWQPYEPEVFYRTKLSRHMRVARAHAARRIEQAAVALAVLLHGIIVDEKGFLVGYESS